MDILQQSEEVPKVVLTGISVPMRCNPCETNHQPMSSKGKHAESDTVYEEAHQLRHGGRVVEMFHKSMAKEAATLPCSQQQLQQDELEHYCVGAREAALNSSGLILLHHPNGDISRRCRLTKRVQRQP